MWQDRAVTFRECAANQTIAHEAAVNEKKLRIARSPSFTRSGDEALNRRNPGGCKAGRGGFPGGVVDFEQTIEELRPKDLISALAQVLRRRHAQGFASIIRQGESDFRMGQRVVCNEIREVITLGRFGAQKLSAGRRVEEKISNGDRRAAWMSRIFHVAHASAFDGYARARRRIFGV